MRLRRCSTAKAKPCARQDTALGAHLTKGCTWEEGQECGPAGGSDEPMRGSRTEGGKCSGIVIVRENERACEKESAKAREIRSVRHDPVRRSAIVRSGLGWYRKNQTRANDRF